MTEDKEAQEFLRKFAGEVGIEILEDKVRVVDNLMDKYPGAPLLAELFKSTVDIVNGIDERHLLHLTAHILTDTLPTTSERLSKFLIGRDHEKEVYGETPCISTKVAMAGRSTDDPGITVAEQRVFIFSYMCADSMTYFVPRYMSFLKWHIHKRNPEAEFVSDEGNQFFDWGQGLTIEPEAARLGALKSISSAGGLEEVLSSLFNSSIG